jgi:aspartyl-tRNA synthetase
MGGSESIRDYIAFPKNNAGRDTMIDAPSPLHDAQLKELGLKLN